MKQSLEAFLSDLKKQALWPDRFVVGYSGGVDSTVLLHALHGLGVPLHAVHVNHQLQPMADDWAAHCENQCRHWGIPFTVLKVEVKLGMQGVEGEARTARYRALFDWMKFRGHRLLLCAHHQDDQLETILLQLFRGSGLRGVGGMRSLGPVGVDRHLYPDLLLGRPLLQTSRAEIQAYTREFVLAHIDDPSNLDTSLRRNWLRHDMMPQLLARFPQSPGALLALSDFLRTHYEHLDEHTQERVGELTGPGASLKLDPWRQLSEEEQLNSLRQWLLMQGARCGRLKLLELARQLRLDKGGIRSVDKGWQVKVSKNEAQLQFNTLYKDLGFEQQ